MSGQNLDTINDDPEVRARQAQMVCAAVVMSPVTLTLVAWYLATSGTVPALSGSDAQIQAYMLNLVLPLAGMGAAAMAFVIKRILLANVPAGREHVQKRFQAALVALALSEAPACMGLALVVLTHDFAIPGILFGASVGLCLYHFPTMRWLLGEAR